MKLTKQNIKNKYWIYSTTVGAIGWIYLLWVNHLIKNDYINKFGQDGGMLIKQYPNVSISRYQNLEFDLVTGILGVLGLYFGLKSVFNKNKIGFIGIVISLALIAFKFNS